MPRRSVASTEGTSAHQRELVPPVVEQFKRLSGVAMSLSAKAKRLSADAEREMSPGRSIPPLIALGVVRAKIAAHEAEDLALSARYEATTVLDAVECAEGDPVSLACSRAMLAND